MQEIISVALAAHKRILERAKRMREYRIKNNISAITPTELTKLKDTDRKY